MANLFLVNSIPVDMEKKGEQVKQGSKTYYCCTVCGRLSFHKVQWQKRIYCVKHYNQLRKQGAVLDCNPRMVTDLNEIQVAGNLCRMKLYNRSGEEMAVTLFDRKLLNLVRNRKWRYTPGGYVRNGKLGTLHRLALPVPAEAVDCYLDHINGDHLDNRLANLRYCTKAQNQMNVRYKGYREFKPGRYMAYIKRDGKMLNLGHYDEPNEADYARWYAERLLFKEFAIDRVEPEVTSNQRKQEIQTYITRKVQRL